MVEDMINFEALSKKALLKILDKTLSELKRFGKNSEFKEGQEIIVGSKYVNDPAFVGEYDDIVGERCIVFSGHLGIMDSDENGNDIPELTVILKSEINKRRKHHYSIHPDDAIII